MFFRHYIVIKSTTPCWCSLKWLRPIKLIGSMRIHKYVVKIKGTRTHDQLIQAWYIGQINTNSSLLHGHTTRHMQMKWNDLRDTHCDTNNYLGLFSRIRLLRILKHTLWMQSQPNGGTLTNPSMVHWPNKYKFISSTWAHDTCSWNDLRYKLRQKSLELPIKDMLTWGYRIMPLWMQSQPNGARMPRIWYYTPTHDVGTCTTNDIDAPPNGTCIRKWWWHAH